MDHMTKHHSEGIEKSEAYLAIITRYYVKDSWHLKECELASALKKPMIACVERGVNWDEYKRFPWIKDIEFDRENIESVRKELGPILEVLKKSL